MFKFVLAAAGPYKPGPAAHKEYVWKKVLSQAGIHPDNLHETG